MVKFDGAQHKVHRIIYKMKTGREPEQIDHDNRKKHDNTWGNLLASNPAKNQRNRCNTVYPDMPPGVDPFRGRYRAQGHRKGKGTIYLGMFNSKKAATKAWRDFKRSVAA